MDFPASFNNGTTSPVSGFGAPGSPPQAGPGQTMGFGVPPSAVPVYGPPGSPPAVPGQTTGFGVPPLAQPYGPPGSPPQPAPGQTTGFGVPPLAQPYGPPGQTTGFGVPPSAVPVYGAPEVQPASEVSFASVQGPSPVQGAPQVSPSGFVPAQVVQQPVTQQQVCQTGNKTLEYRIKTATIQIVALLNNALHQNLSWTAFTQTANQISDATLRNDVLACLANIKSPLNHTEAIVRYQQLRGSAPILAYNTLKISPKEAKERGLSDQGTAKMDVFPTELFRQKPRKADLAFKMFNTTKPSEEEAEQLEVIYKEKMDEFLNYFPRNPQDFTKRVNKLERLVKSLMRISDRLRKRGASPRNPLVLVYEYRYNGRPVESIKVSSDEITRYIEYIFRVAVVNIKHYFVYRGNRTKTLSKEIKQVTDAVRSWVLSETFKRNNQEPLSPTRLSAIGAGNLPFITGGPTQTGKDFFDWLKASVQQLIQVKYGGVYQGGEGRTAIDLNNSNIEYSALENGYVHRTTLDSLLNIATKTAGLQQSQDRRNLSAPEGSPMSDLLKSRASKDYKFVNGSLVINSKGVKEFVENSQNSSVEQVLYNVSPKLAAMKPKSFDQNGIARPKRQTKNKDGTLARPAGSFFTAGDFDYTGLRRIPTLLIVGDVAKDVRGYGYIASIADLEREVLSIYSSSLPLAPKSEKETVADPNKLPRSELIIEAVNKTFGL